MCPSPGALAITRTTLDGITDVEIRQGGSATLVVAGCALDHLTAAQLGDLDLDLATGTATATELRLPVQIPHAHATEALDLTLSDAVGSVHAPNAVTVTPVVIGSTGQPDGRGTFTSPLVLCGIGAASRGDLVQLLDGTLTCTQPFDLPHGVTVRGTSETGTIVRATLGLATPAVEDLSVTTTIERLTVVDADISAAFSKLSLGDVAIRDTVGLDRLATGVVLLGGQLTATNLEITGFTSGIQVGANAVVILDHYQYTNPLGIGIHLVSGDVQARNILVNPTLVGVFMEAGSLEIADSAIEGDVAAIHAGDFNTPVRDRRVAITNTQLRSPGVAVTEATADLTMTDCTLTRGARQAGQLADGIQLFGGTVALARTTLSDFNRHGVVIAQPFAARRDDEVADASLDQVDIAVGDTAIDVESDLDLVHLQMRNSHVAGDRRGLVLRAGVAAIDLGTAAIPGANQIESAGGPAIDDARSGGAVDAHGTTLNGMSFDGQVQGPASVDGAYALTGSDVIRF